MNVCIDTNILVRTIVQNDKEQCQIAKQLLMEADRIAIPLPCLCEFVWVLRAIKVTKSEISSALHALLDADNIIMDRQAVQRGLAIHDAGGDFADAIIAHEGSRLGTDIFVSFDKQAVRLLSRHGQPARLLQ